MPKLKKTIKTIKKVVKVETQPIELRDYDLVVIVSSKVKSEKRLEVIGGVKKVVEKLGGELKKTGEMGLRDLAYTIAGEQSGWYASLEVGLNPLTCAKFEESLKQNKNILRHLLIKK
ncbi:30S ribosomal protein S6 [Candidatus Collierbacteria bacterium]|nr:30S ribosomal protein S6 [Candidatus Collierbacteria bacterium]